MAINTYYDKLIERPDYRGVVWIKTVPGAPPVKKKAKGRSRSPVLAGNYSQTQGVPPNTESAARRTGGTRSPIAGGDPDRKRQLRLAQRAHKAAKRAKKPTLDQPTLFDSL